MSNRSLQAVALLKLAAKVTSPTLRVRLILQAFAVREQQTTAAQPSQHSADYAAALQAALLLPDDNLTRKRFVALASAQPTPPPRPERVRMMEKMETWTSAQAAVMAHLDNVPRVLVDIARDTGLPDTTLRRALAGLAAGGYVHVHGYGTNASPYTYVRRVPPGAI
jgi:hypothetical protein